MYLPVSWSTRILVVTQFLVSTAFLVASPLGISWPQIFPQEFGRICPDLVQNVRNGTKCTIWRGAVPITSIVVNRAIGRAILFAGIGRGMVFRAHRTPNSLRRNRPWNTAPKGT